MTVAKELKGMTTPVMIDIDNEVGQLPKEIAAAMREAGGSMPIVILADPAMSKVYGAYSHGTLKSQDYRSIFRDARRDATADIKAKTFNTALDAPVVKDEAVAKDEKTKEAPAVAVESSATDVIKIEEPQMLNWMSSKGTKIKAKLVAVEDGKNFVFQTAEGRVIRVPGDQLSPTSLADARLIAGIE